MAISASVLRAMIELRRIVRNTKWKGEMGTSELERRSDIRREIALAAREGRTREPLDIIGEEAFVKLSNADSGGAAAIFYQTVPQKAGPPQMYIAIVQSRLRGESSGFSRQNSCATERHWW